MEGTLSRTLWSRAPFVMSSVWPLRVSVWQELLLKANHVIVWTTIWY